MKTIRRIATFAAALLIAALPVSAAGTFFESEQWNLEMIGAEAAFAQEALGQGIRVGVLDSGVNHGDVFGARLLPGHNYIEGAADETDTSDRFGHGTGVAALIAGADENGYIGVAPGAEIVPLKITDGESVKVSTLCRAIYGAIDEYHCSVLSLSLGVNGEYDGLRDAVDYAASKGVVVVAAVGNDGSSAVYYPAGYDSVIGVGAVTRYGGLYSRSNYNGTVFLTAPGSRVRSISGTLEYALFDGTSYAVPQVAGAAAVLLSIDPTLTPAQIMDIMAKTATDQGAEGYDEGYGYGILNLAGCIEALSGTPDIPPAVGTDYAVCPKDSSCVMAAYADLDPGASHGPCLGKILGNR